MRKISEVRFVGPAEAHHLAFKVAKMIHRSGFEPDLVVGIARGGFPPARFICDFLNLRDLCSIQLTHYGEGGVKLDNVRLRYDLPVDISGKKILLVDDVNDTGETLQNARAVLLGKNPSGLRTAVLHEKDVSPFTTDFKAEELTEWKWITYYWAMTEDIGDFLDDLGYGGNDAEEAAAILRKELKMDVPADQVEKVLAIHGRTY